MHYDEIMEALEKHRTWASDVPDLKPCIFCGGAAMVFAQHPLYGWSGAAVRCCKCGAQGPRTSIYAISITPQKLSTPLLPESLERGIVSAIKVWNMRAVGDTPLGNLELDAGRGTA